MNAINFTPATSVTCVRFALVPVFLYTASHHILLALLIFLLATFSDWLDGYLARRMQCQTELGALLDPLADKAMSWAALWVINLSIPQNGLLLASLSIVARDATLSAQRVYHYLNQTSPEALCVSKLAKFKTALLFFSQILLTFYLYAQIDLVYLFGIVLIYAACLLTLISFGQYLIHPKETEL